MQYKSTFPDSPQMRRCFGSVNSIDIHLCAAPLSKPRLPPIGRMQYHSVSPSNPELRRRTIAVDGVEVPLWSTALL